MIIAKSRRDAAACATGLIDHSRRIAKQDHVRSAQIAHNAQRLDQGEPFRIVVVPKTMIRPVIGLSSGDNSRLDPTGVGSTSTVEVDFHATSSKDFRANHMT